MRTRTEAAGEAGRVGPPAPEVPTPEATQPGQTQPGTTGSPAPPGAEPKSADGADLERRIRLVTSVLAPTTLLTALLFYYGYVSTTAEYGYFGVSLGALNLSTQEFLLRSVAALYVPCGVLLLVLLTGTWARGPLSRRLTIFRRAGRLPLVGKVLVVGGVVCAGRGLLGVVVPSIAETEPIAVTPATLGIGVVMLAYGRHLLLEPQEERREPLSWSERLGVVVVGGLVVLSVFWAANSFAAAYGRGRAQVVAENLQGRPAVVLDTTERLFINYPGITETSLPTHAGQRFLYRYRGLRLLAEAGGRMFLVPEQWQRSDGATVVVPTGGDVRVQFYRTM